MIRIERELLADIDRFEVYVVWPSLDLLPTKRVRVHTQGGLSGGPKPSWQAPIGAGLPFDGKGVYLAIKVAKYARGRQACVMPVED